MNRILPIVALLGFFGLLPFVAEAMGQTSLITLGARIIIYAIAAASLNFILGYGGMVSFGHAAFFGVGAYVVGILTFHHSSGEPLWGIIPGSGQMLVTIPFAMIVAGLAALVIGALSLRTGGVQFIMITLAFAQLVFFFFISLTGYGGEDGIIMRRTNALFGLNMRDRVTLYFVILGFAIPFFFVLWRMIHSSFGAVLTGIKQNERRLAAMGIAPYRYKLMAFVLSGMGVGLAGALEANLLRFTSPDTMHWLKSGDLIIIIILGGVGTFYGPILGAAVFLLLEYYLAGLTEHWQLILGLILLVVVLGTHGGIVALLGKFKRLST
ncbi:MAG: branched-chain amino acid ABC transporter permease [Pseudodonghicola sp.]|nr:branched-chain amino acid ABC transporter permease [Pseudodonghicola sp.]